MAKKARPVSRESEPAWKINSTQSRLVQESTNSTWCWGPILLTSKVSATSCNLRSNISEGRLMHKYAQIPEGRPLGFCNSSSGIWCHISEGSQVLTHNRGIFRVVLRWAYLWKVYVEGLKEFSFPLRQVHIGQQTMENILNCGLWQSQVGYSGINWAMWRVKRLHG